MSCVNTLIDVFELLQSSRREIDEGEPVNAEELLHSFTGKIKAARSNLSGLNLTRSQKEDALFAVCSLVDEAILATEVEKRSKWQAEPLQKTFFNTNEAGVEFFDRLDALGSGSEDSNEVREVYLYCLKLGFTGKYFEPGDRAHLDQLIQSNLKLLLKETPITLSLAPITSPAELNTRDSVTNRAFELVSLWVPALAVIAVYFLLRNDLFTVISLVTQDK